MNDGLAMLLLLGILVGGGFLLLLLAYTCTERDRAKAAAAPRTYAWRRPGFFGPLTCGLSAMQPEAARERVFQHLEDYVRREADVAAGFVAEPTVDRLFAQKASAAAVGSLVADLENHVRREAAVVSAFVAGPSVQGLFAEGPTARDGNGRAS